ncbi:MAG: sugar ABC transporter substrate-binding protein [bacterium]|jgi:ribose transport system substrate-binding protein
MPVPTITVFTKNRLNPAYEAARIGADRVAARMGARTIHFVPERPDDIDQQRALVEQAIALRPDAAVFVPVHGVLMDGWVKRFARAGIPLFNMINRLDDPDDYVSFVGADDPKLATMAGRYLYDAMGGQGDVVILEGTPGTITSRERSQGFRDAAQAYPGIRIVGAREGLFLYEPGRAAMEAFIAELPVIDGVAATNDSMAIGAIDALAAAGRRAHVVGVNAIPEAVARLRDGSMLATADFDAMKIASIATEAAIRFLRGEPVPKQLLLPVQVVHRGNCAAYDCPLEQRTCPPWGAMVG